MDRLAAIYAEFKSLDPSQDLPRILDILAEAATLIDRNAEPKKWAAYRLMYAQRAQDVDPDAAIAAYRDSIPLWDSEHDRAQLLDCHYGLGNLLFARIASPADVEAVIAHLEAAADVDPLECATKLALLYSLRPAGDPHQNWEKRTGYLEIALRYLSAEEQPGVWASRRNDLAIAWTEEPAGNFADAMERRIANHLETLPHLNPELDAISRRAYVRTCMDLSEAYGARVAGDAAGNQASAVRYARLAATQPPTPDVQPALRVEALLALARALLNQKPKDESQEAAKHRLKDALERVGEGAALFDSGDFPALAATIERFRVNIYAELVGLGERQWIDNLTAEAESSYSRLDPAAGRTVMQTAAEVLVKAGEFARAIQCLDKAVLAAETALAQATSRAGRLERIWELRDSWALLAYCRAETGSLPEAVEALDRGKARLWQKEHVPAVADRIRTLIPPGGALLFPVFAGSRGAVIIAAQAGWSVAWLENFGKAQLESLVMGGNALPTAENLDSLTGWTFLYATRHVNAGRWRDLLNTIADRLDRDLWQPVRKKLDELNVPSGAELVWFPQGVSSVLPVHGAIVGEYALRYAPSASILLSAPAGNGGGASLVVANPQDNLPNSELEVEWLKQYMGAEGETVLTGKAATRDAVISRLPGTFLFHFAGHAFFQLSDPFQSCLYLAPPDTLTVEDLQPILAQAPPRMVVLSACHTAVAQVTTRPDEALGFPALLLGNGVRLVVAALWPVDDLASALLLGRFYRCWLVEKQVPAQALQSAQNWLRTANAASIIDELSPLKKVAGPVAYRAAEARTKLSSMDSNSRPFEDAKFWAPFVLWGQRQP